MICPRDASRDPCVYILSALYGHCGPESGFAPLRSDSSSCPANVHAVLKPEPAKAISLTEEISLAVEKAVTGRTPAPAFRWHVL